METSVYDYQDLVNITNPLGLGNSNEQINVRPKGELRCILAGKAAQTGLVFYVCMRFS